MVKYTLSAIARLNCLHHLDMVLTLRESRRLPTAYICMLFYNAEALSHTGSACKLGRIKDQRSKLICQRSQS